MNAQLAQVNVARMKDALESATMAGFVARLDELNALADRSPGFVWRFQTEEGNATYVRPFDDDLVLVNLSVWESLEALRAYVYRSAHAEVLRRRQEWFARFEKPFMALWWVPAGHQPSVEEAKERLERIAREGPGPLAFTFQAAFPAPDLAAQSAARRM
jgi:heme-degrading monooxygenase HmoA